MAVIIEFPTTYARVSRHPAVYALRERLQPLADLAERLAPLSNCEARGLRVLASFAAAATGDDGLNWYELQEAVDGDEVDASTWRCWLAAFGTSAGCE